MAKAKEEKLDENKQKVAEKAPTTKKAKEVKEEVLAIPTQEEAKVDKKTIAKAGKRSAKALAETEEKQAKEERKTRQVDEITEDKPKTQQKPPRSKLERRSKNYRKLAEQIEIGKGYDLAQALELAAKTSPVKFDATVELHVRLGVDPRQADQNVRDIVVLPAGTGKTIRVAVFGDADEVSAAKKAGADIAAADEFLQQLEKGTIDFDVLIASPKQMAKLGKYARVLGPKGLMPNPKSGTVTTDVAKAVTEARAGRVEYRVDSTGIVHLGIGKVSFGKDKLLQNAQAVLTSIKAAKPGSLKGAYVRSAYVTTAMGPSIQLNSSNL